MIAHSYRYVRFQTLTGTGYGLFSIVWDRSSPTFEYKVSAAFCSEHDEFHKKYARNMVKARMEKQNKFATGMLKNVLPTSGLKDDNFVLLLKQVANDLPYFPNWARKALNKGNIKLGLSLKKDENKK